MIPQLRIQSTKAQIELQIHKPIQEIRQLPADLSVEQPRAELIIERQSGKLTIDQTLAWENLDLKGILKRMDEAAAKGYSDALEAIGRIAEEGSELMKIENGGNPIVNQAIRNSYRETTYDTGSHPAQFAVKVNYEPGNVTIDWKRNEPIINVNINKAQHEYTQGKVEVTMAQYPSLKIDVVG
ncbi:DUF6470 family protein [Metabacillus fastidiosus]|uniref:DUF6470 family protein n=1 Tax=Metabacillus fastidiosus TaxID=1458 RepID=UPI003D29BB29